VLDKTGEERTETEVDAGFEAVCIEEVIARGEAGIEVEIERENRQAPAGRDQNG
jgi:hypothetical protein